MKRKHILVVFLLLGLLAWSILSAIRENDFDVFLNAGLRIRQYEDLYTAPAFHHFQYFYSPLFAVLLVPFTFIPYSIFETLWLLFMFYNVYDIWRLTESYFNIHRLSKVQHLQWICITTFFIVSFILYNVSQVQMTIFLLWAILQVFKLLEEKYYILAGVLLAFIINIKILPIVFLPYLIYRNYIKASISTFIASIIFLLMPAIFIGWDYNQHLLISWWRTINPTNEEHVLETSILLNSLTSAIPPILTPVKGVLNFKRQLFNLDMESAVRITNLIRIFVVVLALAFLKTRPFIRIKDRLHIYWECSYLFLLIPLIFPQQNKYAYFFLLPAFAYLVYFFITNLKTTNKALIYFTILLATIYTPLIGRDIIGSYLFDILQFYRVMVFLTVLLIPILLYCAPNKLKSSPV